MKNHTYHLWKGRCNYCRALVSHEPPVHQMFLGYRSHWMLWRKRYVLSSHWLLATHSHELYMTSTLTPPTLTQFLSKSWDQQAQSLLYFSCFTTSQTRNMLDSRTALPSSRTEHFGFIYHWLVAIGPVQKTLQGQFKLSALSYYHCSHFCFAQWVHWSSESQSSGESLQDAFMVPTPNKVPWNIS